MKIARFTRNLNLRANYARKPGLFGKGSALSTYLEELGVHSYATGNLLKGLYHANKNHLNQRVVYEGLLLGGAAGGGIYMLNQE
jgi:hypothetical protein